jgi:hypothetical protein
MLNRVLVLCLLGVPFVTSEAPGGEAKKGAPFTVTLSKDGLTVNGTGVQIERTTKAELEKLLGPLERVVSPEFRVHPIGLWDSKGIRIYYHKETGVIQYLDCIFSPSEFFPELQPKQTFNGVLRVDGVEITKTITKGALAGKVTGEVRDNPASGPGFTITYPQHHVPFWFTSDKTLQSVRIGPR